MKGMGIFDIVGIHSKYFPTRLYRILVLCMWDIGDTDCSTLVTAKWLFISNQFFRWQTTLRAKKVLLCSKMLDVLEHSSPCYCSSLRMGSITDHPHPHLEFSNPLNPRRVWGADIFICILLRRGPLACIRFSKGDPLKKVQTTTIKDDIVSLNM